MQRKHIRLSVYILCTVAAAFLAAGLFLYEIIFPLPDCYMSVHPASTVPVLRGFSTESVFNAGTAEELDELPGVGAVISQRIIEGRGVWDGYRLPTDLLLVKGIGEKTLEQMMNALSESLVELSTQDE